MTYARPNTMPHRRGLTLTELIVAAAIAVTAMVGIAQLMYQVTRQYQIVASRNLVAQEAANIMEDLMSRPWKEIASGDLPSIQVSPACLQAVSQAEVHLEIAPEQDQKEVRRITVQIDWTLHGQQRIEPIQLVAWRYQP